MAIYRIEWKPSALKELTKIDRQYIPHIIQAIELLSKNPFPSGCRKLHGVEHTYRVRVSEYRIVYQVINDKLIITIVRVRHRKEAYR
jgi:mRNA interferase RelE/StbE